MGLISRVSSRTYRKKYTKSLSPKNQKWSVSKTSTNPTLSSPSAPFSKSKAAWLPPNGPTTVKPTPVNNCRPTTTTGSTSEPLPLPDNCMSKAPLVSADLLRSILWVSTTVCDLANIEKVTLILPDLLCRNGKDEVCH